jgi:SPASM domain peptide maturase of grasp-with-spasm system
MNYFNQFSNILITKGISRILISDLQRNVSELFPIELFEFVNELNKDSIEDVINFYEDESKEIAQGYLNYLLEKEYGFVSKEIRDKNFPPLTNNYHDYSKLSNLFIEFSSIDVLREINASVEELELKHMVIYSEGPISINDFVEIDSCFKNSVLEGIEIISPFYDEINTSFFNYLNNETLRIYSMIFYNCNKKGFRNNDYFRFEVSFSNKILKLSSCGVVDLKYFNTNLPKVLESLNHNSCLNKKISIDKDGNIKNCPSMPQSFGNIKDTTLEEAVNHKDFKKYWNVNKDMIAVCKDCEFRHICTDCRAYTERTHFEEDIDLSKPLKCGYNPYTNEWAEWSTNPLKQKAIEYYGMQDLVKKDA